MPTYSGSWLDRVIVQTQTGGLRAFNNTSGTWTSTGAKIPRHYGLTMTQNNPVVPTPYKTGTRSTLVGVRGRRSGTFSFSFPLIPNGAAGVVPDCDPLLAATFGQAGTVVASTSVTYNFLDNGFIPFGIFRYNKSGGSSPTNFYGGGCVVQRYTINLGGEYLTATVEGKALYIGDSQQFPSYTGIDLPAAMAQTAAKKAKAD